MSPSEQRQREEDFFQGKRPWSKIKDQVLGRYMPGYLAKVARLGRTILLIDAFAGPGKFEDDSEGSPIIICNAAEKQAPNKYRAIFFNRKEKHHEQLSNNLGQLVQSKKAIPLLGTAETLLVELKRLLTDQTVFLYLDPFGLKGCEFSVIEPFLKRDKKHSTEIVINLSVPIIHRLASKRSASKSGRKSNKIKAFHDTLTKVLGGDYWQDILWSETGTADERIEQVMVLYRKKLREAGLPYVGSCPVREHAGTTLKYYITICSRHPDALLLMNDIMCQAYNQQNHTAIYADTLFAKTDWKDSRESRSIANVVEELVTQTSGKSRHEVWLSIIQQHFMQFLESEYKKAVKDLCQQGRIRFVDVKGTGKLNDKSTLFPVVVDKS